MGCHDKKSSDKWAFAVVVVSSTAVIGLAVASAVLMASARQCTIYADYGARPYVIAYTDFSPFLYLVVANSVAAGLAAVAVFLSVWKKGEGKWARVITPCLAAAVPALLYSSTGAAFATGADLTYCSGNRRVGICDSEAGSRFCSQAHLAVLLALGAALTATFVEVVKGLALSKSSSGCGSSSDSDSEVCGHGCHSKH